MDLYPRIRTAVEAFDSGNIPLIYSLLQRADSTFESREPANKLSMMHVVGGLAVIHLPAATKIEVGVFNLDGETALRLGSEQLGKTYEVIGAQTSRHYRGVVTRAVAAGNAQQIVQGSGVQTVSFGSPGQPMKSRSVSGPTSPPRSTDGSRVEAIVILPAEMPRRFIACDLAEIVRGQAGERRIMDSSVHPLSI